MKELKIAPIEIRIDASEAVDQLNELISSLKLKSFDGVSEHIVNLLLSRGGSLFNYIVSSDRATAVSATHINEITIKVKIIGSTDELAAAIRAGNLNNIGF